MALSSEQIALLVKMIHNTQEVELTCPECLAEIDKYAQRTLDEKSLDGMLKLVQEHLGACPACEGEFKLILETLQAIDES